VCGICGVLGPVDHAGIEDVGRMTRALAHRGPDDLGTWSSRVRVGAEDFAVALGHTRLSILDLSPLGHQPMSIDDRTIIVSYNGEIYNFQDLRRELEGRGVAFRSSCDTEVLLQAYRVWGVDAFARFNGMFAFALFDAPRRRLYLVRDRVGIKPLYWRLHGGVLTFGSELEALRRHRGFEPRIDRGALGRFLRHGYVCGPETIYSDTRRVMPGEYLLWEQGKLSSHAYWHVGASPATPPPERFEDVVDTLDALLGDAVERQMISDVPLGGFLSGGVDSSTVVALMQERSRHKVRTFSIGFEDADYDESSHARAVAQHLGTVHTELIVRRAEAVQVARELPDLYDEPFADSSAIPTVLLSRLTRHHVTVALSGDGGDELFAGYPHHLRLAQLAGWLRVPRALRVPLASLAAWLPRGRLRNGLFHLGAADAAELAYGLQSAFDAPSLAAACGPEGARPALPYLEAWASAGTDDPLRRSMQADVRLYLPDDILVKVDRATMSVGLEARVPILDHRVVELALALPREHLWRGGATKAPLREVLYRRVPRALIERPKHGFGIPIHQLLARELVEWQRLYLAPSRLAEEGNLSPDGVAGLLGLARGRFDHALRAAVLWRLVSFQRWFARRHRGEAAA